MKSEGFERTIVEVWYLSSVPHLRICHNRVKTFKACGLF